MLSDEEVWRLYGDLIEEARQAFLTDPTYLIKMVEAGRKAMARETRWDRRGGWLGDPPAT